VPLSLSSSPSALALPFSSTAATALCRSSAPLLS